MNRPAPTAQGNLGRTPFGHVLLYIAERSLTGSLAVQCEGSPVELVGENLFTFEKGALTQARLAHVTEPLGFLLHEQGAITNEHLNESLTRMARREGLQGEILRGMGVCDEATIAQALHTQVIRKAVRCFGITTAPYQYFDGVDLLTGFGAWRPRIDTFTVLWRGTRAFPEPRVLDPVLARVGAQWMRIKSGEVDLRRFEFDAEERAWVDRLRVEALSLEQFERGADATRARALAYVLLVCKQVELVPAGTARTRSSKPPGALRPSKPPVATRPEAPATGERLEKPTTSPRMDKPSTGERLPKPPTSTRLEKPRSRPSLPPPSGPVSPAMAARIAEAQARLAAMEEETYYQMLGVHTSASVEAVRAAFLEQAARWHPDRVPPDAPALREAYQRIFGFLTEAQEVLTDEDSVRRYLPSVQEGGGTPASQRRMIALIEAATDAQKAEVCLKRREYDEADQLARRALAVNGDDPNALAVLAAVLLERKLDGPPDEALALLTRAVALAPKHDRAHVLLGSLFRRIGDLPRAAEHFRKALEANPKNVDAEREVRVAEMRARNSTDNLRASQPGRITDVLLGRFLKR